MNEILNEWLPGMASMANIHPMVVHFPIALFTSFLLVDLLAVIANSESLRRVANGLLYLGTLGAAGAVAAGFHAADTVEHSEEVHTILERHETFGLAVLGLGLLLSIWRILARGRSSLFGRWVQLMLGIALVSLMTLGADLGGLMVYGHAVAVAPQQADCITPEPAAADVGPPMRPRSAEESVPAKPATEGHTGHSHSHRHTHPHKH